MGGYFAGGGNFCANIERLLTLFNFKQIIFALINRPRGLKNPVCPVRDDSVPGMHSFNTNQIRNYANAPDRMMSRNIFLIFLRQPGYFYGISGLTVMPFQALLVFYPASRADPPRLL